MHKVIPPQKGGGKQEIDIEKHLSLKETTEYIANFYFHRGVNTASGLELKDLDFVVGNFRGDTMTGTEEALCTFGDYVDKLAICPIRLYLHTKEKSEVTQVQ
ncbi:MAG: hypothetical protein ABW185_12145 [Sedimenticola sp.]